MQTSSIPNGTVPNAAARHLRWEEAEGTGTVYTFSTVYKYPPSAFKEDTRYTPAIIDLDEGIRMTSVVENDASKSNVMPRLKSLSITSSTRTHFPNSS